MQVSNSTVVFDAVRHRASAAGALVASGLIGSQIMPTSNGDVTCLLRLHAGQACPGCGMTRATGRFLNGDFVAAFAYHPWVFALVIQAIGFAWWQAFYSRGVNARRQLTYWVWAIPANAVFLIAVWGFRIATGHLDNVY